MTLTRLSGAKSLRDPLLSQLLGEWVASSPLAKARWYEATEVAQLPLIGNKQIKAVKQYASVLFPAPELIGLLMDLNVPKSGFRHVSEFMTHRGAAYTAATGPTAPHPIAPHPTTPHTTAAHTTTTYTTAPHIPALYTASPHPQPHTPQFDSPKAQNHRCTHQSPTLPPLFPVHFLTATINIGRLIFNF